ncbi:MAG: zinc-binding dehydrogenase [Anaerolineales bacterium]|jgi:2-desacetyl-2-hydroxyethyl bacteriochlorophyllide A dehydrogenase|nr:zinc-binding dehydrogenase [Anaerolineales bacterium]
MIQSLYFTAPGQVELRQEPLPPPGSGQVVVQTLCTAISPGTEMLIFRGQFPASLALDENLSALSGGFHYPLRYGYAAAGRVIETGKDVDPAWQDRLVFAFQPHTSHFLAPAAELQPIPEDVTPEQAVFLPNLETALNFVMDGAPLIGEHVLIFGQGIVGLLTSALLAQFPLQSLVCLEPLPLRRQAALALGVTAVLNPGESNGVDKLREIQPSGADLVYELSGAPPALNQAIAATCFGGRVVIGSWYGEKRVQLDLGGYFHRSRIRLISSQVSSLAPELTGRWNKARRFELAWKLLARIHPERWITHRFALSQAQQAYNLIDRQPQDAIQVLFQF